MRSVGAAHPISAASAATVSCMSGDAVRAAHCFFNRRSLAAPMRSRRLRAAVIVSQTTGKLAITLLHANTGNRIIGDGIGAGSLSTTGDSAGEVASTVFGSSVTASTSSRSDLGCTTTGASREGKTRQAGSSGTAMVNAPTASTAENHSTCRRAAEIRRSVFPASSARRSKPLPFSATDERKSSHSEVETRASIEFMASWSVVGSASFFLRGVDQFLNPFGLFLGQCSAFAGQVRGQRLVHRPTEEGVEHMPQGCQSGPCL